MNRTLASLGLTNHVRILVWIGDTDFSEFNVEILQSTKGNRHCMSTMSTEPCPNNAV